MIKKIYLSSKKYSQFQENYQRGALFVQTYTRKKPDNQTKLLGWKVYLSEMGNEALNNLVHRSIDKHLINEEKGMILRFFRDSIVGKNYLGNELKLPDGYCKKDFNNT